MFCYYVLVVQHTCQCCCHFSHSCCYLCLYCG